MAASIAVPRSGWGFLLLAALVAPATLSGEVLPDGPKHALQWRSSLALTLCNLPSGYDGPIKDYNCDTSKYTGVPESASTVSEVAWRAAPCGRHALSPRVSF